MGSTKRVKFRRVIVLVGFMGSGKSTLGPRLARALGAGFVDLDQMVTRHTGKSIPAIFTEKGEQGFRRLEAACLGQALASRRLLVVAAGGGLLTWPVSRRLLKSAPHATVIWLDPSWSVLWRRLRRLVTGARPLLVNTDTGRARSERAVRALWSDRRKAYSKAAVWRLKIRTGETATRTLDRLLRGLRENAGSAHQNDSVRALGGRASEKDRAEFRRRV